MTKQRFFTSEGVEKIKKKYNKLIGSKFYFDSTSTKYKLDDIITQPAIAGFNIKFESYDGATPKSKVIYEFMQLNQEIKYNFDDFDSMTFYQ